MRKGASPGHLPDSSDYVATITPFDPEVHKALLLEMMREAGVEAARFTRIFSRPKSMTRP